MKWLIILGFPAFAFACTAAEERSTSRMVKGQIMTHKATGSEAPVEGAVATLVSTPDGISGRFPTRGLTPGHAVTMWVAIINNPELCASDKNCTGKEVLEKSDVIRSDVTYGDGVVVGPDGTAEFRTFVPTGKLEYSWLGNSLDNPMGAEVHFALHDHGPVIMGHEADMTQSPRGGCTEESLPPPWPASARAGGEPGPNSCQMAQFVILKQ